MIDGEASGRIYLEVLKGKTVDKADTPEERQYRETLDRQVTAILAAGGMPDTPREWM